MYSPYYYIYLSLNIIKWGEWKIGKIYSSSNILVKIDYEPRGAYYIKMYKMKNNKELRIYIYDKHYLDRKITIGLEKR